jgi:hypothetical protein
MKKLITALMLIVSTSTFAAFESKMTIAEIRIEIAAQRVVNNHNLGDIVKSAMAVGINPKLLVELLQEQGYSKDEIVTAAIANGADPVTLLASTASGEKKTDGSLFKVTPAPTFGGGGRSSVSKS